MHTQRPSDSKIRSWAMCLVLFEKVLVCVRAHAPTCVCCLTLCFMMSVSGPITHLLPSLTKNCLEDH